ncbi:LacI family DNA-binding transcriptional regulator [Lysinibacter cavernae]|nr:LacI family DNA-binding transcriptional regulator [Lysinibacter cavernae]
MRDVARHANVSVTTVSFALNNTKPVAPATRARIEVAMKELGFQRNAIARALASKRTHILALLFPALQHQFSGTAVNFFTSAAAKANELGYSLMLWPLSNDAEELTELTTNGLIDGVLLMEVQLDDPRVERLAKTTVPFALIGRTREPGDLTYVDVNFEDAVERGIEHLVSLGHRNICLVDGNTPTHRLVGYGPIVRTETTYTAAMRARGLTPRMFSCDETPAGGREVAGHILDEAPETTAILFMNENAGFGMVSGLRARGKVVPDDISMLAIGSSPEIAALSDPEISLMASPSVELGQMGVEALIGLLENPAETPPQQALVPCTFIDNASIRAPR